MTSSRGNLALKRTDFKLNRPQRPAGALTITELAAVGGFSVAALEYRIRTGKLSKPSSEGLFEPKRALKELAKYPKKGGRPPKTFKRTPKSVEPESQTPLDQTERYRKWKADLAELDFRKRSGEQVNLQEAQRRAFHFVRVWRDRMDGWVSRAAPQLAAKLGVDEGAAWRALKAAMRELQGELAEMDVGKALAEDVVEEGEEAEEDEED